MIYKKKLSLHKINVIIVTYIHPKKMILCSFITSINELCLILILKKQTNNEDKKIFKFSQVNARGNDLYYAPNWFLSKPK